MENIFDWIPFYVEVADKLLQFSSDKNKLFSIIKEISTQNSYLDYLHCENEELWEKRNYEIDPFSLIAMYSRQLKPINRIKIMELLATALEISSPIPTNFAGIPLMSARNSLFEGNDEIWDLFEISMKFACKNEFTEEFEIAFENAINVHGNGLATISMGLFWIRPLVFLNLDSQSRELLDSGKYGLSLLTENLPKSIMRYTPTGKEYIKMIKELGRLLNSDECKFSTIPELSHSAWIDKLTMNGEDDNEIVKCENIADTKVLKWFAPLLQALKDLGGTATPKEVCQKIIENENVDDETLNETFGKNNEKRFEGDIAWIKTDFCRAGIVDGSTRGVWKLTEQGENIEMTDELATKIFRRAWTVDSDNDEIEDDEEPKDISKASFLKWFVPLLQALKDLGGTAKPKDVYDKIIENQNLSVKTISEIRGEKHTNKFKNEVAWARQYLLNCGYIHSFVRNQWKITQKGINVVMTDELASEIFKYGVNLAKSKREKGSDFLTDRRHWLVSAGLNGEFWNEFCEQNIIAIGYDYLEDLTKYEVRNDIKVAMQSFTNSTKSFSQDTIPIWQFANHINIGDIVYAIAGVDEVLGRGIVTSTYQFDEKKSQNKHIINVNWTNIKLVNIHQELLSKTLTEITQYTDYIVELETLFQIDENAIIEDINHYDHYTKEDFLEDVFMSEKSYEILIALLKRKKNIILQGAPGVGKTFAAKRLAYSIMGEKDNSRVEMIQFHQSYSYEDFIMGYRPDNDGFKLVNGAFYEFCKKAQDDKEREYFFIIDEINRGNLSKIFGELFMLIEHDKRDDDNSVRLLYANELFYIPSNIHIIGMMNTADRSLALLDYALRRRFTFFEMKPAFDSDGFKKYLADIKNSKLDKLIDVIKMLNLAINDDVSLGTGFRIGHSYFIVDNINIIDDDWLEAIINYEIIPLLQEYWFDENSKVSDWVRRLQGAIL